MTYKDKIKEISEFLTGEYTKSDLIENLKTKLLTDKFVNQITIFRPYFGLKIISDTKLDLVMKGEFSDLYFSNLLIERNSIFYREIADTKDFDRSNRYKFEIKEKNQILKTIFSTVNVNDEPTIIARQLDIYKPIGNTMLKILEKQKSMKKDIYNEYNERFIAVAGNEEPYNDPIYIGIQFFNIMIREALYKKIEWHMWLYYYYHFVNQICENYSDKNLNSAPIYSEFSNVYSYFLYEIISNLKAWTELIVKDTEEVRQPLESLSCDHENANILKSSIICLILSINDIINENNEIPTKEKESLMHMVFDLYFKLNLSIKEEPKRYGEVLLNCILDVPDENKPKFIRFLDTYDTIKLMGIPGVQRGREVYNHLKNELQESLQ